MRVLLVNNGGSGSSEFSMTEARFPIGLGYLSAMLKLFRWNSTNTTLQPNNWFKSCPPKAWLKKAKVQPAHSEPSPKLRYLFPLASSKWAKLRAS